MAGLKKDMKILKIAGKIFYWMVLTVVIAVAGLTAISVFNVPGNYKLLAVQSGSMAPAIKTGSVVTVKPSNSYKVGDVITFRDAAAPKKTTTHRIFEVRTVKDQSTYVTKGDANDAPDSGEVSKYQILGKVIFAIPLLGYTVSFAKTMYGLILLIIVPAILIIYNELINIKKEAVRLMAERQKRKLTLKEEIEEKIGEEVIEVEKEGEVKEDV